MTNQVVETLSRLGVASLVSYIGEDKVSRFHSLAMPITSELLSEILYGEKGINVFRHGGLRAELLASLGAGYINESLGDSGSAYERVQGFNNFSWGNNSKSKKFLNLFGLDDSVLENRVESLPAVQDIDVPFCLHPYQNWVRKEIIAFFGDCHKTRTLVHMPTGAGKTRTTMEAVCDFIRCANEDKYSILWLAHSEELCEQAIESFQVSWRKMGTENVKVVRMWGGNAVSLVDDESPIFVVMSFQTAYNLLMATKNDRFQLAGIIKKKCGLIVVDEAHQSTATTYKDVINLFSRRDTKLVGLTATPGRHHVGSDSDSTVELSNFYQNNKINIVGDAGEHLDNPIEFLTNKGVLAHLERYSIDSGIDVELTESEKRKMERLLDIPSSVLKKLGESEIRTNLVAAQVIHLALERGLPTIVFAPSKDNAIELATLLTLKGCRSAAVTSETPSQDRRDIIDGFKNSNLPALINFGVLTTGFDAPNIKAVVIARPTTSVVLYSQMIGRGLRGPMMGGEKHCILVDVLDNLQNMPDADQAFTFFDEFYE
jgi:DNA repair protein RadD